MSVHRCRECGFVAIADVEPCCFCFPAPYPKRRKTRSDKGTHRIHPQPTPDHARIDPAAGISQMEE